MWKSILRWVGQVLLNAAVEKAKDKASGKS